MEITKTEKIQNARMQMAITLIEDIIRNSNYSAVQKLCETFKLSNARVLKKLSMAEKIIPTLPSEQIFIDWVYVIYDESEYNALVLEEFHKIYAKKYPHIEKEFRKAEQFHIENKMQKSVDIYNEITQSANEIGGDFFLFLMFSSEVIYDYEQIGMSYKTVISSMYNFLFVSEKKQDEWMIKFNTGERVLETSQYQKYLKKRRTELAEYMSKVFNQNIIEEKLGEEFDKMLVSKATNTGVPLDFSLGSIVNTACRNILINHNGGIDWYESVTNRKNSTFELSLDYKPNVDDIIEKYYIQLLRYMNAKEDEEISKIFLSRECKSESPLIDMISIMFMYNIDVFSKMHMNLMEEYYRTFSWEKIVNQGLDARYEEIINSLKENINFLKGNLENANIQIRLLNEQMRKEKGAEIIPLEKLSTEYNKKLEEKDNEIEKLKQQLRSKDEFIELLENGDDADIVEDIDISVLQSKKYLFVGFIKEAMPELHKQFPNSLFMESENFSLVNVKVDGIVMLIKYMSHGMFYKIRSVYSLSDIPVVRCNTKNINTVYNAMQMLAEE